MTTSLNFLLTGTGIGIGSATKLFIPAPLHADCVVLDLPFVSDYQDYGRQEDQTMYIVSGLQVRHSE